MSCQTQTTFLQLDPTILKRFSQKFGSRSFHPMIHNATSSSSSSHPTPTILDRVASKKADEIPKFKLKKNQVGSIRSEQAFKIEIPSEIQHVSSTQHKTKSIVLDGPFSFLVVSKVDSDGKTSEPIEEWIPTFQFKVSFHTNAPHVIFKNRIMMRPYLKKLEDEEILSLFYQHGSVKSNIKSLFIVKNCPEFKKQLALLLLDHNICSSKRVHGLGCAQTLANAIIKDSFLVLNNEKVQINFYTFPVLDNSSFILCEDLQKLLNISTLTQLFDEMDKHPEHITRYITNGQPNILVKSNDPLLLSFLEKSFHKTSVSAPATSTTSASLTSSSSQTLTTDEQTCIASAPIAPIAPISPIAPIAQIPTSSVSQTPSALASNTVLPIPGSSIVSDDAPTVEPQSQPLDSLGSSSNLISRPRKRTHPDTSIQHSPSKRPELSAPFPSLFDVNPIVCSRDKPTNTTNNASNASNTTNFLNEDTETECETRTPFKIYQRLIPDAQLCNMHPKCKNVARIEIPSPENRSPFLFCQTHFQPLFISFEIKKSQIDINF